MSGVQIHCVDKCLTMNRRNKKIGRERLSVNCNKHDNFLQEKMVSKNTFQHLL